MNILDAYCCAGGATRGYQRAGHDVHGVDVAYRPDYCGNGFSQTDAVEFVRKHGAGFDFIHASPPCQASCALTNGTNAANGWGAAHVDLLAETREALEFTGRPYVIEQPVGLAKIRKDLVLCGEMFGLGVIRHRVFEFGGGARVPVQPAHVKHRGYVRGWRHGVYRDGPYLAVHGDGGGKGSVAEWRTAMGIPWMTERRDLAEAIPPAYTEWIGERL